MKKLGMVVGAVALAGLGLWYFLRGDANGQGAERYKSAVIDRGDVAMTVTATGTISAVTTVQVGSQVSGSIAALYADFNTPVTKGQLVAELDPTTFEGAVAPAYRGTGQNRTLVASTNISVIVGDGNRVPTPGTLALTGLALAGLAAGARWRKA